MKIISLTFDYELFFGKSGTFNNSIYRPTNDLVEIFDQLGIKATFFIDVLYYQRLLDVNSEEAQLLKEQLQMLVLKGHRIELHLHPHWLDAKYENNEWIFSNLTHYRLQSLPEKQITDLFISGCQILNEIANEVVSNYSVIAFRAGGWCITPFEKLKDGFLKSGIKIDSSIAFGIKIPSQPFNIDFTKAPNQEYYKFSENPTKLDNTGSFYQIPITTYRRNNIDKILNHIYRYYFFKINNMPNQTYGDGSSIPIENKINLKSIYKKFSPNYGFLSIEDTAPVQLINRIRKSNNTHVIIMSHPKNISQISFECIKALHSKEYTFLTLFDLLHQI